MVAPPGMLPMRGPPPIGIQLNRSEPMVTVGVILTLVGVMIQVGVQVVSTILRDRYNSQSYLVYNLTYAVALALIGIGTTLSILGLAKMIRNIGYR